MFQCIRRLFLVLGTGALLGGLAAPDHAGRVPGGITLTGLLADIRYFDGDLVATGEEAIPGVEREAEHVAQGIATTGAHGHAQNNPYECNCDGVFESGRYLVGQCV